MDSMNQIIVIAGTQWQIPLIKKLKERGYQVICFNLLLDSPAFQYADDNRVVDILDYEACLKYAKELNPMAVMSDECDIAVPTVAYLSEKLNLRTIGYEMAELYTNKYKMRLFCQKHNLCTPQFYKCSSIEMGIKNFIESGTKMIMKPLDSNSSRGVYTINSKEDIRNYFEKTVQFSKGEKSVLLEEYIDGTEFTVDGIMTDHGHVSLAISKKKHYNYNENIASSLYFSHKDADYDYEELKRVNDQYVNLSGLSFGLTHAEYKFKDGRFYLIEIGARGGGNLISAKIVPLLSGVDNYEYLIDESIGVHYDKNIAIKNNYKARCAVLQFFDTEVREGTVKEIKGDYYLKDNPRILDYCIYCNIGDKISEADNDSKRIGYYIAYGENERELQQIIDNVNKYFKIVVED